MARVCLLTNVAAPYRLPVFEEINRHHSLDVWFCRRGKDSREWDEDGSDWSFRSRFLDGFDVGPARLNTGIRSALRNAEYDVWIVGEAPPCLPAVLATLVEGKRRGTPTLVWTEGVDAARVHETYWDFPQRSARVLYDRLVRRPTYTLPDGFVAYSGCKSRRFLQRRGVAQEAIYTGTQVMPASLLGPRSDPAETDNSGPTTVLVLSYLRKAKGIDDLITAFETLDVEDVELVVAGSGPDGPRLKKFAAHVDGVNFVGHVSGDAKWDQYKRADVFVLPTHVDTWGMVVNEAMYFGLPVVTTEAAGASQLVSDTGSGIVVPPGEPDRLSTAIQRLLYDQNLYRNCQRRAIDATKAWDPSVGAAPFVRAIDDFVSS